MKYSFTYWNRSMSKFCAMKDCVLRDVILIGWLPSEKTESQISASRPITDAMQTPSKERADSAHSSPTSAKLKYRYYLFVNNHNNNCGFLYSAQCPSRSGAPGAVTHSISCTMWDYVFELWSNVIYHHVMFLFYKVLWRNVLFGLFPAKLTCQSVA